MTAPAHTQKAARVRQARAALAIARQSLLSHAPAERVIRDALEWVNEADTALTDPEDQP